MLSGLPTVLFLYYANYFVQMMHVIDSCAAPTIKSIVLQSSGIIRTLELTFI